MSQDRSRIPNDDQQAVISELDRNIILFASAGTGKTFTVAKRVCNILDSGRAKPEEILCLTFTTKAANEMKDDILDHVGEAGKQVDTRTIHSFTYQVLKEESTRNPELYCVPGVCDETDTLEELKNCAIAMKLPEDTPIFRSSTALPAFSSLMKHQRELLQYYSKDEGQDFRQVYDFVKKNDARALQKVLSFYDPAFRRETRDYAFEKLIDTGVGQFMHMYNDLLSQSNLLDFDDLICLCHKLLREPKARDFWRKRFKYIIIDEMQDTSELEYDTLKQLFAGNHIMMCGDYFQTIYEWRGSKPDKVLVDYIREFDAVRYMFARNYRSTRLLTQATFGYLKNTYPGLVGQYCPAEIITQSRIPGEKIQVVRTRELPDEARWIYSYLEQNMPEDPTKVCIMARSNTYIARLYEELASISQRQANGNALRFFTVDNDSKFFRKAVIKDILAFMSIIVNPTDAVSLDRIARKYITGVGRKTIEQINENRTLGISLSSFIDPRLYQDGDPYAALMDASESGNIVVYDTETTGLDLSTDQIIQISAIRLHRNGKIIDQMDQMVIPTIEISAGAQATHHQTREDIIRRGGIGIREALEQFAAFAKGAVLVGHNSIRFDSPLVSRQLRENSLPKLDIIAEYDTMVIAKQLYPKLVNYKLDTLCQYFHIVNEAAHDALGDITATGKVLQEMLTRGIVPKAMERRAELAKLTPGFRRFFDFVCGLRSEYLDRNRVAEMVEHIVSSCGLLDKFYKEKNNEWAVADLLYALKNTEITDAENDIRDFLSDAALSGSQMDLLIQKLHKIPIITVHQSKGCEFETVIIAGADDDNFPNYNAKIHGAISEEERVFYVAITRAKRKLILTSISQKTNRGGVWPVKPSRFIERIPSQYIDTRIVR